MSEAANYTSVDFDTAYQVLLASEANDDYMRLCVAYENNDKSDEIRNEIVYRYNIAKQWDSTVEKGESVPLIKCHWHAKYIIKVFEMFMEKEDFGNMPMRCLATGKSAQQLQEEDALAVAEARKREKARATQIAEWKSKGLCTACGGTLKSGLFGTKCTVCKVKF